VLKWPKKKIKYSSLSFITESALSKSLIFFNTYRYFKKIGLYKPGATIFGYPGD